MVCDAKGHSVFIHNVHRVSCVAIHCRHMWTLYVTTTLSTCWQSGRSLAASLPYQYHKTDNGMICALNG